MKRNRIEELFLISRLVLLSRFIKMVYENQWNLVKVFLLRVSQQDTMSWKASWVSASITENEHRVRKTDSEFSQDLHISSTGLDLNRSANKDIRNWSVTVLTLVETLEINKDWSNLVHFQISMDFECHKCFQCMFTIYIEPFCRMDKVT